MILRDGRPIGRIYVARRDREIRVLDIALLPDDRNARMGSALLKDLLAEAAQFGKPVCISVEHFDRSLRLFERLGFSQIDDSGIHVLMQWRPRA